MFESIKIYKGEDIKTEEFFQKLVDFGYQRVMGVSEMGDFARRGGIIDVFPLNFEDPVRIELSGNVVERILNYDITTGKSIFEHNFAIILPIRGISPRKLKKMLDKFGEELPIDNFVDIEPNDCVVHLHHGIGRYLGIEKLKLKGKIVDHIVIEYAGNDRLYVPIDEMNLVQKYIGFEGRAPKLYKLGTKLWQKVKSKAKEGIWLYAKDLLELQAMRSRLSGYGFSKDADWQRELEKQFPYEETPDQLKAAQEVKNRMELPRPMDMLICGDVGYGKTEVALRAAFKAVMDNKQVAILVPTTILAEQHYKTFTVRMKEFPVRVEMLSRFRTAAQQRDILAGLEEGGIDIIIGTHRLLSGDIRFKDLGLVIIDEEQRFGVKHKERLKKFRLLVDVLTLTATPIPRTLYMSLVGMKDLAIINTPPPDRLPIETHVAGYDDEILRRAITRELGRKGQAYFINNTIQGIEKMAARIRELVPQARIVVAHGELSAKALEDAMRRFIDNEAEVLISTAIVESGIDIPNANTLIVNRADTFGLADLYQLRGRVGRFKQKAYAYFLVPKGAMLSGESQKRLRAIEKFTELGAGFKVAMQDLQIRGAGNLLGVQQHGYVETIGFDLYCRLLREAVAALTPLI